MFLLSTQTKTLPAFAWIESNEKLELTSTQVLPSHGSWKCQWNVTGTVLATSGDAGVVQLWKSNPQEEWKCVSQIHGDLPTDVPGGSDGGNGSMTSDIGGGKNFLLAVR